MNDDLSDIRDYYAGEVEREDERLQRHQLERDLTWRYFNDYLPPTGRILEIGAATGGHTVWLASRGYPIVSVDLSKFELARCQEHLTRLGFSHLVDCRISDARWLNEVPEQNFDAVLLMGPLYHLIYTEDRLQAVQQAVQRLKPGGTIIASFISRLGILGDLMKNVPGLIEELDEVRSIIDLGYDPPDYPRGGFRGYFAKIDEIEPLFESTGVLTQAFVATEPCISADDEGYNKLTGQQRELWLDLMFEISRERCMLASSRHWLYIGRKP